MRHPGLNPYNLTEFYEFEAHQERLASGGYPPAAKPTQSFARVAEDASTEELLDEGLRLAREIDSELIRSNFDMHLITQAKKHHITILVDTFIERLIDYVTGTNHSDPELKDNALQPAATDR